MLARTIALEIAIRALKLTGEVIIPSYTFVATAHALFWQGITPVFADINPDTHNLDPESVRKMITPRTTGIIGVHLWGRGCDTAELEKIGAEFNIPVMYDAAHAFGCSMNGKMIGGFGRAEVFSFHATKFFNTFEGGAIVTDDDELADTMRLMRNFGFYGFDNVIHPGTNGKMIEACAAMGLTNLDYVDTVVQANYNNYLAYIQAFSDIDGLEILRYDESEKNNFQYIILQFSPTFSVSRDRVLETLHKNNVLARRYFWPGCHKMKPYRELFPHAGLMLKHSEDVAAAVIVLPTGTTLPTDAPLKIAQIVRNAM
jgi:dTDP-4-amino-4,6-dideoxygalactose transaminase